MTDSGRRMDPSTLNMILMLKINKDLWGASIVEECMKASSTDEKESTMSSENDSSNISDKLSGSRRSYTEALFVEW